LANDIKVMRTNQYMLYS